MRLWSVNLEYVDTIGLVTLWRESLLAKNVLSNKTVGYKNHPQLIRFKNTNSPLLYINTYLFYIYEESLKRNHKFDKSKIDEYELSLKINANDKQLKYEFDHLQRKLKNRSVTKYKQNLKVKKIEPNKMFTEIKGNIEEWEKNVFEDFILSFDDFMNSTKEISKSLSII